MTLYSRQLKQPKISQIIIIDRYISYFASSFGTIFGLLPFSSFIMLVFATGPFVSFGTFCFQTSTGIIRVSLGTGTLTYEVNYQCKKVEPHKIHKFLYFKLNENIQQDEVFFLLGEITLM